MALWGSVDNAANSDIAALVQVSSNTQYAVNRTTLYNNTTANVFQKSAQGNVVVGQFGVASGEIQAANEGGLGHPQHAGWVLRHEGKGLKAGRVWYETLVAMGSMSSDGSDDTQFRDYTLKINTQPSSNSSATAGNLTFTVAATSVPTGATLTYQWQRNNGGWTNVAYSAGQYFNPTTLTLTANNITANGNVFRVMVMTTGANTVYSSNATIAKV
jgi:hypothetical protein